MVVCRLLGHRHRFRADGVVMRWECERGCGASGSKVYASPMIARRYSRVLNRRDLDELGRRAPWVATMPLRLWHSARKSAATGVEPS